MSDDELGDLLEHLPTALLDDAERDAETPGGETHSAAPAKREVCARCDRPLRTSCLCDCLPDPSARIAARGKVTVLQHPFERRRKLKTAWLVRECVQGCEVVVGRKFSLARCAELRCAVRDAQEGRCPLLVLYPVDGERTLDAGQAARAVASGREKRAEARGRDCTGSGVGEEARTDWPDYHLVAIDGTWGQAKEMFARLRPHLIPPGWLLRLDPRSGVAPGAAEEEVEQESGGEDVRHLRTEPEEGCVTTAEAIATALAALEPGGEAARAVLKPLRKLASQQHAHDPGLRLRAQGGASYKKTRRNRISGAVG